MQLMLTQLTDRAFLRLSGADVDAFLQNLITQNIKHCKSNRWVYSALLTPQGKLLFDFLLQRQKSDIVIDCEARKADALAQKLKFYTLRMDVAITPEAGHPTIIWAHDASTKNATSTPNKMTEKVGAGFAPDPRHAELGYRRTDASFLLPQIKKAPLCDWHAHRLSLGIAQGCREMPDTASFPLEYGLHLSGAIDFQKGCFIGQEVTSRIYRKGQLRKALWPITAPTPPALKKDTPIFLTSSPKRQVGEVRCWTDGAGNMGNIGLAILRFDALDAKLHANGLPLTVLPGLFGNPSAPHRFAR